MDETSTVDGYLEANCGRGWRPMRAQAPFKIKNKRINCGCDMIVIGEINVTVPHNFRFSPKNIQVD